MAATQEQLEARYREFLVQFNASLPAEMSDAERETALKKALDEALATDLENLSVRHQTEIGAQADATLVSVAATPADEHAAALEQIRQSIAA